MQEATDTRPYTTSTAAPPSLDTLSDEERRKVLKPSVTAEQARTMLRDLYVAPQADTTATADVEILTQLESYDDVNFKVRLHGTLFLLKIHNGVESADFGRVCQEAGGDYYQAGHMHSVIHLQTALMELLACNNVPTSAPVPTVTDQWPVAVRELPVVATAYSPQRLVVRLLTWVDGTLMATVPLMPIESLADTGRLLGQVHGIFNVLSESRLQSPNDGVVTDPLPQTPQRYKGPSTLGGTLDVSLLQPARRYHQWDGKHTADLEVYTQYIADERRRGLVRSVVQAFVTEIIESNDAAQFRIGMNHGDFNDANILLAPDLTALGVIDFGDSTESWRVLDVTVAMAYAMLSTYGKGNRGISAAAAVLRGYHLVNPLLPIEKKHLVLLVACRLACSVTLGAYSYQQNPENKYLLFHAEPAWKALELIWCYDETRRVHMRAAFNRVLEQACLTEATAADKVIDCADLVVSDPVVEDLLASVRFKSTVDTAPPPSKKHRLSTQGLPIITFVTGNVKKLNEVRQILGIGVENGDKALPFEMNHHKVDLPELQGDPIDIAVQKCKLAAEKIGGAVITEDTSLCFHALQGLPGPYIKWFLDKNGLEGLNKMLDGFDDRSGYAQTIVCFCTGPGKEPAVFDGRTQGTIVRPRGDPPYFGWDPIFEPVDDHAGLTYAEMTVDQKNAISHRGRALAQLHEFLQTNSATLRDEIC